MNAWSLVGLVGTLLVMTYGCFNVRSGDDQFPVHSRWNTMLEFVGEPALCAEHLGADSEIFRMIHNPPFTSTTIVTVRIDASGSADVSAIVVTDDDHSADRLIVTRRLTSRLGSDQVHQLALRVDASRVWGEQGATAPLDDGTYVYFEKRDVKGCRARTLVSPDCEGVMALTEHMLGFAQALSDEAK